MRWLFAAAAALILPLVVLLFAQWPLRDVVQAGSRQANDAAQILFALVMAVGVAAAGRAGTHLRAPRGDANAPWRRWTVLVLVGPWAAYLLWSSAPTVWQSLLQQERFAETLNPGYFLVRLALWLLAALALVQAFLDAMSPRPAR
ncbi:C4-dicarboxylate ABC transporter substrate-binding protein [Ramlibacter humi]|uniref:C4-dicarboxylate ABC transporter substrate-binding protein n=1 Tax=Ramlibacter humi TaxID=2530451 RepID=A0A4Z0CDK9_9BURK|nr:C4-dicarboxylate ABC transporter substrate-binding protein [Ramlibacter humi]TFZ08395.1 C4-dicarboxylate ABC transporter substrate-binding protein [Ramlibacter humi]